MRRYLPSLLGIPLLISAIAIYFNWSHNASAAQATHVVISEIQIEGSTSTDEFVELYNPTSSPVDLTNWVLYRKTQSGTSETPVATLSGQIPANGFYLLANTNFDGGVSVDKSYSENIADNNSIVLRDNLGIAIDIVGLGSSLTREGSPIDNPIDNRSVERKANSASTNTDMANGGAHSLLGNGEDSENNSLDFVRHVSPQLSTPQNTNSTIETLSASPSPTSIPTPTIEPSTTPSPTIVPSSTPSPTTVPSPTSIPSPTPSNAPSATPSVSVAPSPSPSITPSPTPSVPAPRVIARGPIFVCSLNYRSVRIITKDVFLPFITCARP
jgi:hypothetical protein